MKNYAEEMRAITDIARKTKADEIKTLTFVTSRIIPAMMTTAQAGGDEYAAVIVGDYIPGRVCQILLEMGFNAELLPGRLLVVRW